MTQIKKVKIIGGAVAVGLFVLIMLASKTLLLAAVIPEELQLNTTKDNILGRIEYPNGDVKYAYKSNVVVPNGPSQEILRGAQANGYQIAGELIERRSKHAKTFRTNVPGKFITEIVAGSPQYYKDGNGIWWQAEYATTTRGAFDQQTAVSGSIFERLFGKHALAATSTSTFYPDPNPENNTADGFVRHRTGVAGTGIAWASLRGGAGTDANDSNVEDGNILVEADTTTSNWRIIDRASRLFDTSAIPDTDTIESATYSESTQAKNTDNFNCEINIYSSAPASNTALVSGDFDSLGDDATSGEPFSTAKTMASMSGTEGVYSDWTLNSSGIAHINKTGITKFGVRESKYDAANVEPTWASGNFCQFIFNNSEETGTSKDPKLVVVHGNNFDFDVRKSADEGRSSTIALTDDSELKLNLAATTTYVVEGVIFAVSSSVQPDLKIAFVKDSNATMDIGFIAADNSSFRRAQQLETSGTASGEISLAADVPVVIHIKGTVKMGSTSGNFVFQWAQNTSNGNPVTVKEGSYLKADAI